ncbi:hypothetical protein H5J25_13805 [Sphingomonas aliaeris]|uniref:Uncharacterized protein n=1 Tax=Sphingomonas aliaeris TaxID=2759526 RepID=A0A974NT57_9SPHN|nr:hypothetical protein [Sphingomonas aliaeris]QQV76519.1 hypothetical protein H5J25_13805 [Sphingomonas aliaeris]
MTKAQIADAADAAQLSPLEFMLAAMNDPSHDLKFRAQMAQAAAPYVHGKPGEEKAGKKAAAQDRAREVAGGNRFRPVGTPSLSVVKQ